MSCSTSTAARAGGGRDDTRRACPSPWVWPNDWPSKGTAQPKTRAVLVAPPGLEPGRSYEPEILKSGPPTRTDANGRFSAGLWGVLATGRCREHPPFALVCTTRRLRRQQARPPRIIPLDAGSTAWGISNRHHMVLRHFGRIATPRGLAKASAALYTTVRPVPSPDTYDTVSSMLSVK